MATKDRAVSIRGIIPALHVGEKGSSPLRSTNRISMDYVVTFFAVFLTDIIYTFYLKSVQLNNIWKACFWATAVTATASVAVISYTENHMMLIPSLLGAFVGTWFGMKYMKKD